MRAKILMFGWEFPPHNSGGLGVACQGLVRALSRKKIDVTFVLPRTIRVEAPYMKTLFADQDASFKEVVIDSPLSPYMTAHSYESHRKHTHSLYGLNLMQEVMRYAAVAKNIVQGEAFDVIYAHDWLAFPAGMAVKRATGKPFIVHVHATEIERCGGESGINEDVFAIERDGMRMADRVVAVSERTKRIIVEKYGIPARKVRVIYNGIDNDMAPQPVNTERLMALKKLGNSVVLFVGRLTLQKGPDYFIRAAKRVLDVNPHVLFVVSGSGDMERPMIELASHLGIMKNIFFTGFLRGGDLHEVFQLADLFVMPSVAEPFGIAALEAIKTGTPVLMSKQSGVSEVVRHALKADFWDVEEMANKILSVVTYPALSKTLIEHAAREADGLTWGHVADNVTHLVGELTS